MNLSAKDVNSTNTIKSYSATENDSINFKNSPLYSQINDQRAVSLKNTKKFFRRLSDAEIGLTVYKTPNDILLTIGGIRETATTGDVLLGVAAVAGMALTGTGGSIDGLLSHEHQVVYFESLFDQNFEYKNLEQQRLHADYIAQFHDEHDEISLENVFPYKDFYIMAYYDKKQKRFVLRRFADDK